MERYELDRAQRRKAIIEREDKERKAQLASKALQPVREASLGKIEKTNSGERSNLRRRIFENYEITKLKANASKDRAKKEHSTLNE